LIDRLTVHETRFRRHESSCLFVEEYALPALLAKHGSGGPLRFISVGCSTGEEVYTLSMIAEKHLAARERMITIYGLDISRSVIERAARGRFRERALTNLDDESRKRFFDKREDVYVVGESLLSRAAFCCANALHPAEWPEGGFDMIFSQNMLIYFARGARLKLLDIFADKLQSGGFLVLGIGESQGWLRDDMRRINFDNTLVYEKS
ncbi:MAG: protein-glutamate O-methyltransferase CheR, partial [Candidatus Dadabacteria bacterium]|nr:protein-glutamate O-methyltransferase CheR [Candidatus Dadabacteria bacterium]